MVDKDAEGSAGARRRCILLFTTMLLQKKIMGKGRLNKKVRFEL